MESKPNSSSVANYEASFRYHVELERLFYSIPIRWEQRPCFGFSSWFRSKQSDHWRKNIPVLAESHRVYSIDLIGYGYSDKPNPRELGDSPFYTFETWGSQINDFCKDVVKDEAFFICNSIGGLVGLQAAVADPSICKGIMLLNISLRMLHITKQMCSAICNLMLPAHIMRANYELLDLPGVELSTLPYLKTQVSFRCILCGTCLIETFTLPGQMLQDPRRLYAPGRLYHVIVRKPFGVGRISPVVKTAVPVDGRFEHMVISCHVLSDHSIALMEFEFSNALNTLKEKERVMDIPPHQRMERSSSVALEHSKEHKAALARAVSLDVPQAYSPSEYGTFQNFPGGEDSAKLSVETLGSSRRRESWDELAGRLFETDQSGQMVLKTNWY